MARGSHRYTGMNQAMLPRDRCDRNQDHAAYPMLVAFPVTFYTATWLAFVIYAFTDNAFWWQLAMWSNLASVVTTLLAASPRSLARLATGWDTRACWLEVKRVRLKAAAFLLLTLNLILLHDRWLVGAAGDARPLASGAFEVTVLPNATLPLLLSGSGLLLTALACFWTWALSYTETAREEALGQPRLEVRVSRSSLV